MCVPKAAAALLPGGCGDALGRVSGDLSLAGAAGGSRWLPAGGRSAGADTERAPGAASLQPRVGRARLQAGTSGRPGGAVGGKALLCLAPAAPSSREESAFPEDPGAICRCRGSVGRSSPPPAGELCRARAAAVQAAMPSAALAGRSAQTSRPQTILFRGEKCTRLAALLGARAALTCRGWQLPGLYCPRGALAPTGCPRGAWGGPHG